MSRSIPSLLADGDDDSPYVSQLDPASLQSPILDMDPIPGYDDTMLAVLHAVQTAPADEGTLAKRLGISKRQLKRCLNQLVCDGRLHRQRMP